LKFAYLDYLGISPARLALAGLTTSALLTISADEVLGNVLGGATGPALVVVSALVFYAVVSTPRRMVDSQRVAQARESVLLSAAATACLDVVGSGPRTVLLLRSRDEVLARALSEAGRKLLLGASLTQAIGSSLGGVSSYSAAAALNEAAHMGRKDFEARDEETRGLANSSELSRETKLPVFMTACFFTPIMLLLYAVFSRLYGVGSLVELVALEFIVLDLAFYFGSGARGQR